MADDGADGAVVHRGVGVGIEERRLQDRRGEGELVQQRVVGRVDRLRVHPPFGAIDRLAEARHLPLPRELASAADVLEQPALLDGVGAVVAPLRRVADAWIERRELLQRFGARRLVHPRQRLQPLAHRRSQVRDERVHRRLVVRREVLGDVDLPHALADLLIEQAHAALPAVALHLDAAHRLAEEGEAGLVEGLGQVGGLVAREMEGQILLPGRDRLRIEERGAVAQRRRLVDHDALHLPEPAGVERHGPSRRPGSSRRGRRDRPGCWSP